MRGRIRVAAIAAAAVLAAIGARDAFAAKKRPSCDKVLAASEEGGGKKSADEIAKQLGTTPARVRHCLEKTGGGKSPVPLRKQPAPGEPPPSKD